MEIKETLGVWRNH